MIESRGIPGAGVMASLTSGREAGLRVRRIAGLIEIGEMAADAGGRCSRKLSADVAGVAIQSRVRPGQRKIRRRPRMIKLRTQPVVHAVTLLAPGGELE